LAAPRRSLAPFSNVFRERRHPDSSGQSPGASFGTIAFPGSQIVHRYLRGGIGYFGLARQFDDFAKLDGWIRRRVRMCYWKQWRYPRTKVQHLVALGVNLEMAIKHAISRKQYWRMSRTPALRYAMPNKWLEQQGLLSLKQLWYELASLRGTA